MFLTRQGENDAETGRETEGLKPQTTSETLQHLYLTAEAPRGPDGGLAEPSTPLMTQIGP